MLRLVHEAEPDEEDEAPPPRRRAQHEDERARQERGAGYFHWRRPSVLLRVARSLWLGAGFAVVGSIAYLAGAAAVLDPLFRSEPVAAVATPSPAPAPAAKPRAQVAETAPAATQPHAPIPNVQGLVLLIRNAIVALHQANVTGDYAVLRALAAPEFQARNDAAALSQAFTGLRAANIDLAAVAAINPRLYTDPVIDADGFLRLSGFVPLAEAKVDFEFAFETVNGRWRLFGLGVHPPRDGSAAPAAKPATATALPDNPSLLALIRGAVLGLNQANISGDYSVLRDLSAIGFQQANSPAKLSDAFANIRARGLDLAPVAVIDPRLFRPAAIDANGYLRLAGYFPSQPETVNFDLAFRFEDGQWRIFAIGVDTAPADQPATALAQ
ncbi:MAG: hypothetical protein WDM94_05140 [Bauldia sp.]